MIWVGLIIAILVAGAFVAPAKPRSRIEEDRWRLDNDPASLAVRDPAEALARYGTDADARRLIDEGRGDDLAGLGWHPPEQG